ncbi:MAG TPA: zf-HC2 domain-containing protein [Candidatus Krumholzibacteria bacterium]|nr:zf-HC2 domain-containing protein [Candidatus Krumholzibacteria bacterium]
MNCENAKNLIQTYLEGRMATLERNEFVHHVTECAACEREVIAYREVFQSLRDMPRLEAPGRISVAVLAELRAEGLVHEPRFSAFKRLSDRFFAMPAAARYPAAALIVIALLYAPVALLLGRAGRSLVEIAESVADAVVWVRGVIGGFPGTAALDTYLRAVRTIAHAAGGMLSPVSWLLVIAVVVGAVYSMSRILRRKRHSGHALFSF